jgi:hypothetical protein
MLMLFRVLVTEENLHVLRERARPLRLEFLVPGRIVSIYRAGSEPDSAVTAVDHDTGFAMQAFRSDVVSGSWDDRVAMIRTSDGRLIGLFRRTRPPPEAPPSGEP